MLAELPNGFVQRLRDVHYKRKLEERRQTEMSMKAQQQQANQNNPNIPHTLPPGISNETLEDVMNDFM